MNRLDEVLNDRQQITLALVFIESAGVTDFVNDFGVCEKDFPQP